MKLIITMTHHPNIRNLQTLKVVKHSVRRAVNPTMDRRNQEKDRAKSTLTKLIVAAARNHLRIHTMENRSKVPLQSLQKDPPDHAGPDLLTMDMGIYYTIMNQ